MPGVIPGGADLRIVGDVHGDIRAFRAAAATDRFLVQLGDLSDHGPDSAGVIRLMLEIIAQGQGLFILGNHDRKLGRALSGFAVRSDGPLEATMRQMDDTLKAAALSAINAAPAAALGGVVLGRDYPKPIVDLAFARGRALAAFRAAVRDPAGQEQAA